MAWLGRVSLGGFPDLAGAVNKLSESVKNIEKNFDSALGLEENSGSSEASGLWPLPSDSKALFEPVMSFMGHKEEQVQAESIEKIQSTKDPSSEHKHDGSHTDGTEYKVDEGSVPLDMEEFPEKRGGDYSSQEPESISKVLAEPEHPDIEHESKLILSDLPIENESSSTNLAETIDSVHSSQLKEATDVMPNAEIQSVKMRMINETVEESCIVLKSWETENQEPQHVMEPLSEKNTAEIVHLQNDTGVCADHDVTDSHSVIEKTEVSIESSHHLVNSVCEDESAVNCSEFVSKDTKPHALDGKIIHETSHSESYSEQHHLGSDANTSSSASACLELEMKKEMKMMEAALQGAARQAQAKADEIAKLMNENEQLKSTIEELKRKTPDAVNDALKEEYHQRVATLERKVYALTRERDALRREQSRKSDSTALLKEKDEIIAQVMAEGEELSKKQASQESQIRKLKAQIRDFEEEKQRLNSKLQVEEAKVESIKRDKAATEKLLQETIERNQTELVAQKEFYTSALIAAKEAEALAEARANNEAKTELESRLKEAGEREATLIQTLEELRQTLSRTQQQAVFREDMLQRDIDDLQKRYQDSERRCEELITQVPESTRPLLRQIEALQETTARRAEAWAGVERALNSRLQEAEAKAAAAEERERSMNERLSQTLSRMAVLEAQISCLRAEQTQLTRSLEKERQRASENRQEYLVAIETAATNEGRTKQLEDEIKELRNKHKLELQEQLARREVLEKELEREKTARLDLEKSARHEILPVTDQISMIKDPGSHASNGTTLIRKLSSAGSLTSMEESYFLQTTLDSDSISSERRATGDVNVNHYFLKTMTPSAFEATLRQKDGELSSYLSRLASLESTRDSLAEELVKVTAQSEKLRAEADLLPAIQAELDALRRRHSSALELMGERDEELEELRADIADLKEMYREQVDLLVNKIQVLSSSIRPT